MNSSSFLGLFAGSGCIKENSAYLCIALSIRYGIKDDSVAQLVEHIPFKDGVLGPNPSWVTFSDFNNLVNQ